MSTGDVQTPLATRFENDPVLQDVLDGKDILRVGESGAAVRRVQLALVDLDIPLRRFGADGAFGRETKRAVETFQRQAGLTGRDVDGIVGPKTMRLLNERFVDMPPEVVRPDPAAPSRPDPGPRDRPTDDQSSEYRVLSGVHLEGLAFGLIDEAAVYLLLDCDGCEITDATVGESVATFMPGLTIDIENGPIRDVSVRCGREERVPGKRVSVTVSVKTGVETLGSLSESSETFQLTACCCGCPGGGTSPGVRVPDDVVGSDDIEEWMDEQPAGGVMGGLFSSTTEIGGRGAVR